MDIVLEQPEQRMTFLRSFVGWLGIGMFVLVLGMVSYFDDIQLVATTAQEVATIYNVRVVGLKIVDWIALSLGAITLWYLSFKREVRWEPFHRDITTIFLVYCYAGVVGFIYSFSRSYDYLIWVQDFQQTLYMVGFSLVTFHLIDSKTKWKVCVVSFLVFLAAKNVMILGLSLAGVGKAIGDWAFRASQNSEFAYFPMMFFPLLLLLIKQRGWLLRLGISIIVFVYLFNSLLGIYRTVWVMLMLGGAYLLMQLDKRTRFGLIMIGGIFLTGLLLTIGLLYPRFLELAWGFKFASIFDWSLDGDRSNATRMLEVINIVHHVFGNFAFVHGMGLGAWWDDSARRLLPDLGSGFTYKTRFHTSHMWYLTQFLKLGLVAMIFYWMAVYRMFKRVSDHVKTMSWLSWEKSALLGLNIGLLCAFISSADFVRLFTFIGINLGLTASYISICSMERRPT